MLTLRSGQQPAGPLTIITETVKAKGLRGIYSGCGALVAGNAAKAGVRFLTYDQIKSYLADENVSPFCHTFIDCCFKVLVS